MQTTDVITHTQAGETESRKKYTPSIEPLIVATYQASFKLRMVSDEKIVATLQSLARAIEENEESILTANKKDVDKQDPNDAKTDRLRLTGARIKAIAESMRKVSLLPNPSGRQMESRYLPNGLHLEKMAVPLGVVGAIFESRPNVVYDIASLCLRSMNACLLKGSSDAENSNIEAIRIIKQVLQVNDIDPDCVTLLPADREVVEQLFTATKYVDVIVPRGSEGLIKYVRKNSLVPVIETGAGVCHIYVHQSASLQNAAAISLNAKITKPAACNAVDSILVDRPVAAQFLSLLSRTFEKSGIEIFADREAAELLEDYPYLHLAGEEDFGREFLSLKCAIKVVSGLEETLLHLQKYSTKHSEAILAEDAVVTERFLNEVDAAVVLANASTRFTDGEEFGLGAEIGISTQKLHARGPFALEKLVTEKWVIRGKGQVRT